MLDLEKIGISLLLALVCGAVAWLARGWRSRWLVVILVLAVALGIAAAIASPLMYPVSDPLVLLIAWSAGILLGQGMPPRIRPWLILLLILSALDIAQITLTGGFVPVKSNSHAVESPPPSGPLLLGNFYLALPGGHYLVGIFDLLIITALAEYWRRRGSGYLVAVVPGIAGFLLGEAAVQATQLGGWPLLPFFTVGWLISLAVNLATGKRATVSSSPTAIRP